MYRWAIKDGPSSRYHLNSTNWILKFVRLFVRHFPLISDSKHHEWQIRNYFDKFRFHFRFRAQDWFARATPDQLIFHLLTMSNFRIGYSRSFTVRKVIGSLEFFLSNFYAKAASISPAKKFISDQKWFFGENGPYLTALELFWSKNDHFITKF